jgi:hypothetical protein
VGKPGVARPSRGGRPRGSDHLAPLPPPQPLSSLRPDGASPRPERLPREEWAKAPLPPSLPALRVVPVDGSDGGFARMGEGRR